MRASTCHGGYRSQWGSSKFARCPRVEERSPVRRHASETT